MIFISFSSIIIRFSDAHAFAVGFYRVFLASAMLLVVRPIGILREVKQSDNKIVYLTILSGFFLALHFASWITSLDYTTISNSVLLVDSAPIFSIIFGYHFLNEKVTSLIVAAVSLTLVGAVIIGWGDISTDVSMFKGDVLAMIGALTVSAYYICGRYVRPYMSLVTYSATVYAFAALFMGMFCLIAGIKVWGFDFRNYALFLLLALFPTIGGHSLFQYALKYMKAYVVNLTVLGEVLGATILAFLIFNEAPSAYFYPGAALVIGGIIAVLLIENNDRKLKDRVLE